jgi:hypothetical protein
MFVISLLFGTVVLSFALFMGQLYLEACIVKLGWTVLKNGQNLPYSNCLVWSAEDQNLNQGGIRTALIGCCQYATFSTLSITLCIASS